MSGDAAASFERTHVMAGKERRLALTIKGGVSLGAYEAGVIDELFCLNDHNNRSGGGPWYIDTLAGASAGAITAALLARVVVNTDPIGGVAAADVMHEIWVRSLSLELLTQDPLSDNTLLSSVAVKNLANGYLGVAPGVAKRHQALRPQPARLGMVFSLSALELDPTTVPAMNGTLSYNEYAAEARFDARTAAADALGFSGIGTASFGHRTADKGILASDEAFHSMVAAAITSGAFPIAFAPHGLAVFKNNLWIDRYFVDGGAYDNDPIGKMMNLAHDIDWDAAVPGNDDADRRFMIILTEPTQQPTSWPPAGVEQTEFLDANPLDMLGKFLPEFMEESMTSGLRGIGEMNRRIYERSLLLSNIVSVLNTTAGSFDFATLRSTVGAVVDHVAVRQGLAYDRLQLFRSTFVDDLRGLPDALEQRARALGARPNVLEAFVELGLMVDLAAGLADKVLLEPIVVAPPERLAGDPVSGFNGFFHQKLREHDYQQGRADALAAMKAINDPAFEFDPAHQANPPDEVVLSGADLAQYTAAQDKFADRIGVVALAMLEQAAGGGLPGWIIGHVTGDAIKEVVEFFVKRFLT